MGFIKSLCFCPILPPAEMGPGEETICPAGNGLDVPQSDGFPTAWIPSSVQVVVKQTSLILETSFVKMRCYPPG